MASETVSVAELKAKLSQYLARARAGETIEVTLRGKPVVRFSGISEHRDNGLDRLIAEGALTPGDPKPGKLPTPIRLDPDGPPVSQIVLDDRGPR